MMENCQNRQQGEELCLLLCSFEAALLSLVRQHTREKLRKELGTFDIDLTPEELERLRNAGHC